MRQFAIAALLCAVQATAAAAPCSRDAIARDVRALGGDLDAAGDRVQIELRRAGTLFEGSLVYTSTAGDVTEPRVVRAESCAELTKSLALIVVMSLRADEPAPASTTAATTTEPLPSSAIANPPIEIDTRAMPRPTTRHLAVFAGAASNTYVHAALELGTRWRRDRFSLGVELHFAAPETIDVGDGGTVRVGQTGLDAVPCFHAGSLGLCALASAGLISAEGQSLANAASVRRAAVRVGGRIELDVPLLDQVSLRIHLDGLQTLTSSRFLVDKMPVWTSEPRELWLGAGVLAKFP